MGLPIPGDDADTTPVTLSFTPNLARHLECPAALDRMWMQHHNGVFVSDDAGNNWRELADVPPSSFGFTVAVHPSDPDTAWFVAAIKDEQHIAGRCTPGRHPNEERRPEFPGSEHRAAQ